MSVHNSWNAGRHGERIERVCWVGQSNTYGATTGAATGSAWLRPQGILSARLVTFNVQVNF